MEDKIREAINNLNKSMNFGDFNSYNFDMIKVLLQLAEMCLSVGEKMPSKLDEELETCTCSGCGQGLSGCSSRVYNKTVEQCTLITTKLLAEKDAEIAPLKTAIDEATLEIERLNEMLIDKQLFNDGSVRDRLLSEDDIKSIIDSFDGNSIICTSYDDEPSISDSGVKRISKAIYQAQQDKMKEEK